jgi:hypothetical protein
MHDVVKEWCVEDRRRIELLAGDGRADDGEDSRADDSANAQRGQRPRAEGLFEPMFRLLRFEDQLVDRLAREELVRQNNAPRKAGIDASGFKQKTGQGASVERV